MTNRKKLLLSICGAAVLVVAVTAYHYLDYYNIIPKKSYTAEQFRIETVKSSVDFNQNGKDDYRDFLDGARIDAKNHPQYKSSYYQGGYPPDSIGVCTDVIWRAFKQAGYCLKDMVNEDIKNNKEEYKRVKGKPDPNIDFRRVPNLKVYFERHAVSLTLDPNKIEEWQPGDIIVFSSTHVGMLSDKRNKDGIPYLIHNSGQPVREEDALLTQKEITGHYRFDASRLKAEELIAYQ